MDTQTGEIYRLDEKIKPEIRKRLIEGEHEDLLELRRLRQQALDLEARNLRG